MDGNSHRIGLIRVITFINFRPKFPKCRLFKNDVYSVQESMLVETVGEAIHNLEQNLQHGATRNIYQCAPFQS